MQDQQNSTELARKFNTVKDAYPKDRHPFIHAKSIDHFIYHFDKIPGDLKPAIYDSLVSYFNYIKTVNITNARQSQKIFQEYLSLPAAQYVRFQGFHIYIKPRLLLFVASLLVLILYFLSLSFVYYVVLIILVIAIFTRQYYYTRQKKVFCPMY